MEEFQRALAKAGKATGAQREAYLRQAISLHQGDYLEDIYSEWTAEFRAFLQRGYFGALEELADYCARDGRHDEAVEFYRKLLDKDPLREDIHRQVMRCLVHVGDRVGAMKQFDGLRRILSEELGVEPSAETIKLFEDLVGGEA